MRPYALPPGDPYLPPGCTQADIDRALGGDDDNNDNTCAYCGEPLAAGKYMCRACFEMERAERRRDELKDESQ